MARKPKPKTRTKPPPARTPIAPRKVPRQERAQATVEAIVEATARVLREQGYDGLTTNKVADAAGVSVGSLYQYFPGKDALVTALLLRFAERQQAAFFDVIGRVVTAPIPVVIDAVVKMLVDQAGIDLELAVVRTNRTRRAISRDKRDRHSDRARRARADDVVRARGPAAVVASRLAAPRPFMFRQVRESRPPRTSGSRTHQVRVHPRSRRARAPGQPEAHSPRRRRCAFRVEGRGEPLPAWLDDSP